MHIVQRSAITPDDVYKLGLSKHICNALKWGGIETVDDLIDFLITGETPNGKTFLRNFGIKSRRECIQALSAKGLIEYQESEGLTPVYGYLNAEKWEQCLKYWDYKCVACGKPQTEIAPLVQDHWLPKSSPVFGGSRPDNIIPLCSECNIKKGGQDPLTWFVKKLGRRYGLRRVAEILAYFERHWKAQEMAEMK